MLELWSSLESIGSAWHLMTKQGIDNFPFPAGQKNCLNRTVHTWSLSTTSWCSSRPKVNYKDSGGISSYQVLPTISRWTSQMIWNHWCIDAFHALKNLWNKAEGWDWEADLCIDLCVPQLPLTNDSSALWSGSPYLLRLGARLPWHRRQKSGTLLSNNNMKQHLFYRNCLLQISDVHGSVWFV